MSLSPTDYQNLYKLQDKVFRVLREELQRFYLTGGTVLGRFYLNHRYSDDLDFFIDRTSEFHKLADNIYFKLRSHFELNEDLTLKAESYVRFWISSPLSFKIDFVNEIPERWGVLFEYRDIKIDNPANILANKLGAVVSRDEPKDVFDILTIAATYYFNWQQAYRQAVRKQLMNEIDIAMRLSSFPVNLFQNQVRIKKDIDIAVLKNKLNTIVDDFLLGSDNSLASDKPHITTVRPHYL